MSDFNYQEYLKNNPLLQKEVKENKLITESQEEVQEYVETSGDPVGDDLKKLAAFVKKGGSKAKDALKKFVDSIEVGSMQQAMASEELEVTEEETLNEGVFDKLKDKALKIADKIKNKFSADEIAKMKAAVKKALGKDKLELSDITLSNVKKVVNVMKDQLAEGQLEESLGDKIKKALAGTGMVGGFAAAAIGGALGGLSAPLVIGGLIAMVIGGIIQSNIEEEIQEEVPSSKMKVSELKAKIKEDIISLLNEEDEEIDAATDEIEPDDAEIDVEDEVEADIEAPAPSSDAGLSKDEQDIQDSLKVAYDKAVSIGDEKLADQIGNSITFFTRSHVVER